MQIQQSNSSHPVQGKGAMVGELWLGGGGGGVRQRLLLAEQLQANIIASPHAVCQGRGGQREGKVVGGGGGGTPQGTRRGVEGGGIPKGRGEGRVACETQAGVHL